jgi:hypothetical protein
VIWLDRTLCFRGRDTHAGFLYEVLARIVEGGPAFPALRRVDVEGANDG